MSDSLLFDTSDDEELREQLDMHSIIVSCVNDEPLFTADQVQRRVPSIKEREPRLQNRFLMCNPKRMDYVSWEHLSIYVVFQDKHC